MICVNVCSMYYFKVISPTRSRVQVLRIEPGLDFPLFCRNCENAPCISACPETALFRTSKGIVMVNNKKCSGQGECIVACPYNAIRINPDTGKAIKCIQCGECVERCPVNAIWITSDKELEAKDTNGDIRALYEYHKSELYNKEGLE